MRLLADCKMSRFENHKTTRNIFCNFEIAMRMACTFLDVVKVACLLSLLDAGHSFIPSLMNKNHWHRTGSIVIRSMGYLDDMSPQQPQEPNKSRKPPLRKRTGGVPSGRGPLGSYLEQMTGESPPDDLEPTEDNDDGSGSFSNTEKEKTAGWSDVYLTDFLTQKDDSRTDIRSLLTQRSIQSFMYLLEECRVSTKGYTLYFVRFLAWLRFRYYFTLISILFMS